MVSDTLHSLSFADESNAAAVDTAFVGDSCGGDASVEFFTKYGANVGNGEAVCGSIFTG